MHTVIRTITHFNYPGILSMLAVGILGFPIPEEMLPMFLGSIVSRRCAHWSCGGCATFYPNRLPLEAYNVSLVPTQGAIRATYPNRLGRIITSSLAAIGTSLVPRIVIRLRLPDICQPDEVLHLRPTWAVDSSIRRYLRIPRREDK